MPADECHALKKYCENGATAPKGIMWAVLKDCPLTCGLKCGK